MASVNKVILIGNVGKDPEVKVLENGMKIVLCCVATHETTRNKDGSKIEQTEWHNIVIKRENLADIAEKYLEKGKQIYLEGKIKTRNWDDRDGVKKSQTEIIVDNFIMLGKRKNELTPELENNHAVVENENKHSTVPGRNAEDVPF